MNKKLATKNIIFFTLFIIFYFLKLSIFKVIGIAILGLLYYRFYYNTEKIISERDINEDFFDKETGLYNMRGFNKIFSEKFKAGHKYFILIDLVSLKRINSFYGRELGDRSLKNFIVRVKQQFDYESVIARFDYKKVLICFQGYDHLDLNKFINSIQKDLNKPFIFDSNEINIKTFIAALESNEITNDLDEVFYKLETILKKAKENNIDAYEIYNNNFSEKHKEKLKLERELERAINNRDIKAYYQPQIDIKNSKLIGFEALIRWESEEFGILTPGKFLEIAEEQGLYRKFFYLILENVCMDIADLKRHIKDDFKVSINISDMDLKESDYLLRAVNRFLEKYNLDGKYLELELTENLAIHANERNKNFFNDIKSLGINLVLDDFGIGYSSFGHLKNFPIDKIKLDQEFIREINEDPFAEKIVISLIELCRSLNIDLLAEGIETADQLMKLKELGCYKIQGYIFGKAIPVDKVLSLIDEGFYQLGIELLTKELEI